MAAGHPRRGMLGDASVQLADLGAARHRSHACLLRRHARPGHRAEPVGLTKPPLSRAADYYFAGTWRSRQAASAPPARPPTTFTAWATMNSGGSVCPMVSSMYS